MRVLIISRKKKTDIGGLARFYNELSSRFPKSTLKPDLIHLCDATLLPLGIILKLILQKPLTLTAHGKDLTFPNPLYQLIIKLLLPSASAIILDSQAALHLISRFGISPRKIFVIPPGISITHLNFPNHLYPERSRRAYLPNLKAKFILLTVGNLVLRKGHVWFLRKVLRKLPKKFVYLIAGEGPQKDNIEHTIRRLRLSSRVFLVGRITNSQLAHLYQTAHIYVCPNQHIEGDFEGFGIAAGEAAAMGLPVVASAVDGIPEVIRDGKNGILVQPSPQAFIEAIEKLRNHITRKRLGQKAKIYTRKYYNWQKVAQKYKKVWQSIF